MNTTILRALLKKEFTLMRRNPIVPKIVVMLPVMVMLVIPLVANLDVKHVAIAAVDHDWSQLSRRVMADIDASENLTVRGFFGTYGEAMESLEHGEADVIITIPSGYEKSFVGGNPKQIDLAANGVNATKGSLGAVYAAASVGGTLRGWALQTGADLPEQAVSTQYRYNPTLNFRNFMIPALMVVLLILICGFLPALNLVGEKESGTIEAMNVSPLGKMTFVLSKLIPYWMAGLLVLTISMVIGWLVYGLAPAGSTGLVYLAACLFALVMSGLGIIIANKSETMLQSILVMFAVIMVFQLMSGLFTPIASMPEWAQTLTYAVPPRYFIEIMRDVYLKGTTLSELLPQFTILSGMAVALCLAAALTYRKQA